MNNYEKVASGVGIAFLTPKLISAIVMFLLGLSMILVAVFSSFHYFTYIETTATIVDQKYDEEFERYIPIFEYDVNGKTVRYDGIPYSEDEIVIGEEVEIAYNPKNPGQFDIGSKSSTWGLFLAGILLVALPGSFIISVIRAVKNYKNMLVNKELSHE